MMKQMLKVIKFSKFILDGGRGRYTGNSALPEALGLVSLS
jgi:hypothetical protein